jgi:hypothetical protein
MVDVIVDVFAEIVDLFMHLWVDKVVDRFMSKK